MSWDDEEYRKKLKESSDVLFQNTLSLFGQCIETAGHYMKPYVPPPIEEAEEAEGRGKKKKVYVQRDRLTGEARLHQDYFAEAPTWGDDVFRRRFRMTKGLFNQIVQTLEAREPYFQQRQDATGRLGFTAVQKCTMALRQLATGGCADHFDEYLRMGESTGRLALETFCRALISAFGSEFLRTPTMSDCARLLHMHESRHGFPGMLGSIDCMHWPWKNCPNAWRGAFTNQKKGYPTVVLEAVASQDLWIWHAFFGVAGSNNDINVLNQSDVFDELLNGKSPAVTFYANGERYKMGYYLADGIYPSWPTFVKTLPCPTDPKRALFATKQEAARKDVERAFGVLKARWAILSRPARPWFKESLSNIMYACIILHNMIVQDEGDSITQWSAEEGSSSTAEESTSRGASPTFQEYLQRKVDLRNQRAHAKLQEDLIEEIWARFGG